MFDSIFTIFNEAGFFFENFTRYCFISSQLIHICVSQSKSSHLLNLIRTTLSVSSKKAPSVKSDFRDQYYPYSYSAPFHHIYDYRFALCTNPVSALWHSASTSYSNIHACGLNRSSHRCDHSGDDASTAETYAALWRSRLSCFSTRAKKGRRMWLYIAKARAMLPRDAGDDRERYSVQVSQ